VSYKPLDLQVSMPRSIEMTTLQHQQQQRSVTEQSLMGQQAQKTAEQNASRSAKAESASGGTISEKEPRHRDRGRQSSSGKKQEASEGESKLPEHPFKGKHIDFIG